MFGLLPFNLGLPEMVIILVILLIIMGPGKLPEVGKALGRSIKEFRKASDKTEPAVEEEKKS